MRGTVVKFVKGHYLTSQKSPLPICLVSFPESITCIFKELFVTVLIRHLSDDHDENKMS
jgi:hypothetical protein